MSEAVDPKWIRGPADVLAIERGCHFEEALGDWVCEFIETFCCQSKGEWAGQPLKLLDWQRDFIKRLFGWRRPDGRRRYRRAYLLVAKKNGKSTLVSALVLALLEIDDEGAPEIYLNAVDKEQAAIIFDEAKRMVEASPELRARLKILDSKNTKVISDPDSYGKIVTNSADVPSKDGVNASGVVFDELHRQKTREMWDIFEYASTSRRQPIKISITTAGEDESGVWYEQMEYSEKVNSGEIDDITHLGVVYRALETDDLDDPETWKKANPSMGFTMWEEDFGRELAEAKRSPSKFALFKRLRLNLIVRSSQRFLSAEDWLACGGPVVVGALEGEPCYMGLDLSSTQDLSSLVTTFPNDLGGFDVVPKFYLPEDNIVELEHQHGMPYREWASMGLITLTPGNVIDYDFIEADVIALSERYQLKKLVADPYFADRLAQRFQNAGLPVEFLRQTTVKLNGPTKELERLVLSKRIRHGNNPIMRWMVSNTVLVMDSGGNVKPDKKKSQRKIDGVSALVNAVAGATRTDVDDDGPSVYETRGAIYL